MEVNGEFAGFRFCKTPNVEPLYKGKHAFNLLHFDESNVDFIESYQLMYHRSKDRLIKKALVQAAGVPNVPRLDQIWDGEC